MAAPKSNGVLRTNLADMKIGDYIKWQYNDDTVATMGTFSGTVGDTELPLFTTEEDFCIKNVATGTLDIVPKSGYFYFIKVAPGLVIADRALKVASKQMLNSSNFLKGNTYRCLTNDEIRYITNSDLNGAVAANDSNVFHRSGSIYEHLQSEFWDVSLSANTSSNPYMMKNSDNLRYTATGVDGNISCIVSVRHDAYRLFAYRPAMEYVDNPKSTNIYY